MDDLHIKLDFLIQPLKFIQEKFGDTPGTSKRHLEDVFAEANVSDT